MLTQSFYFGLYLIHILCLLTCCYSAWSHRCRSKLAASVLAGVDNIHIKPGCRVLYLGAASGTSVSHVSDIVGPTGAVYAVEFSHRSGKTHLPLSLRHVYCACVFLSSAV